MSTMLECALLYARRLHWPVFPCAVKQKRPATPHGCLDATLDEDKIKWWWTKNPNANIAIATGKPSGAYVIDVDYDSKTGVNGYLTIQPLFALGIVPPTPCQFTPRGGCHLVFSSQAEIPCVQSTSYFSGIDLRGRGGYILVAPSTMGWRRNYMWNPRRHPLQIPLAPFPDWMRPPAKATVSTEIKEPCREASCVPEATSEVLDRARKYLAYCDPAVQGARGHDKLLWAASAMIHGFCLREDEAASLLAREYNPRCDPPWNLGNGVDSRDFYRKISEASKLPPSRRRGWLLNRI